MPTPAESRNASADAVLTVTELNRRARQVVENSFALLWVSGEVSNLTHASSGHVYFSLKDEAAQVRCVMFRNKAQLVAFRLAAGMRVEVRALVTLYEARGDFQLNVEAVRQAGVGALYEAFARLRQRLADEGLFAPERKRALPAYPRCAGIVTSLQAAALRDVLIALARRAPHLPLVIYPSAVQGADAPAALVAALRVAGTRRECDVLLLVRGGGSIEDLWAFNDERVARALAACPIPVVCGVGHETDLTIADFVADRRAATPTAAAELASAAYVEAAQRLGQLSARLTQSVHRRIESHMQRLDLLAGRLASPGERLARLRVQLAHARARLASARRAQFATASHRVAQLRLRVLARRPTVDAALGRLNDLRRRLAQAASQRIGRDRRQLESLAARVAQLDPQAALRRGYAIVRDRRSGIVRSSAQLAPGDEVGIEFAQGSARSRIIVTDE